jgi:hypothetical protein
VTLISEINSGEVEIESLSVTDELNSIFIKTLSTAEVKKAALRKSKLMKTNS